MIAELQKVQLEAAVDEVKKPLLSGVRAADDNRTINPRTPRAEERMLREEDDRGEKVRRRKLTARACIERRQRGPVAGKSSMNIIAALGL